MCDKSSKVVETSAEQNVTHYLHQMFRNDVPREHIHTHRCTNSRVFSLLQDNKIYKDSE
jgi:hypothetical protein